MILRKIKITNFRNYTNQELEFSPDINIISGENGSGKTNILESISVISPAISLERTVLSSETITALEVKSLFAYKEEANKIKLRNFFIKLPFIQIELYFFLLTKNFQ